MINNILVHSDLGRKPLLVASVDCSKAFDTVSFSALLEPLSDSPYHTLARNLTNNQRLRA